MPSTTPYYSLPTYSNAAEDEATSFYNYRIAVNGPSGSGMALIDTALHNHDTSITNLNGTRVVPVNATYVSPGYFEATQSLISSYYTGLVIALKLSQTSAGTTTLKVNALTTVSLMKINDAGTAVNITGDELVGGRYYLFNYDGTQFVWVNPTDFGSINTGYQLCNGRLTLNTVTPITTADVTAATTIYFTPYQGNKVGLYTGTNWKVFNLTEKSIKLTDTQTGSLTTGSASVTGLTDTTQLIVGMEVTGTGIQASTTIQSKDSSTAITLSKTATSTSSQSLTFKVPADKNLDIFCYSNSGTPKLEMVAWVNDSTRATALTTQDGTYVKNGDTTRRYLGTVRTTSTAGQTEDSLLRRFVWNCYNRVSRPLKVIEGTDSWTYSTSGTWQQARASTTNQVAAVFGLAENPIDLTLIGYAGNSAAPKGFAVAIGEDSTTTPSTDCVGMYAINPVTTWPSPATCKLNHHVSSAGYHFFAWLEQGSGAGTTTTWFGDNGLNIIQSGMVGSTFA